MPIPILIWELDSIGIILKEKAYFAAVTLNNSTTPPDTDEISVFALQPKLFETDYLFNKPRRVASSTGQYFTYIYNYKTPEALQSFWMGNGQQENITINNIINQALYNHTYVHQEHWMSPYNFDSDALQSDFNRYR